MNEQAVGRPKVARFYAWGIALAALVVIVQGFLFAGFYSRGEIDFRSVHGEIGDSAGIAIVVILIPLGFLARFPKTWQIGWWTLLLAVAWNIQSHVLGRGIADVRSLEMGHIPLAFLIFALALYLSGKTYDRNVWCDPQFQQKFEPKDG